MDNLIFTICSINYLPFAKTLFESIYEYNKNIKFVYVVCDKLTNNFDFSFFGKQEYIQIEDMSIPYFKELLTNYNIIEFNTSVKPYAFKYLSKKYNVSKIMYLDPDIYVTGSLDLVWEELNAFDFLLTPHHIKPIVKKEDYFFQKGALNTGVFNLGFFACTINPTTIEIINWWEQHMINHGHCNSVNGEFYDQKILNLLPIHSEGVKIMKHFGLNVAPWNLHERKLSVQNNSYYSNQQELIFFHFSGFLFSTKTLKNVVTKNDAVLNELLETYASKLTKNNYSTLSKINCYYNLQPNIHRDSRLKIWLFKFKKLWA